jgi:predicted ATPase
LGRGERACYALGVLTDVHLRNFSCFREASIRLRPLTVLVGPNASGKTTLLRAIIGQVVPERDVWRRTPELEASVSWSDTELGATTRSFKVAKTGTVSASDGRPFPGGQLLHLDPTKAREPQQVAEQKQLSQDGHNLANVIATLPRRQQEQLAQDLARLIPVVQDVDVRPAGAGKHRLVFQDRWDPSIWYEPTEVSDGTILTLGLLTLRYQSSSTRIVAIEEPEHGMHPYLIGEMVTVLRQIATGAHGRSPLQIVLATQSATLLEFLQPEEVRFLSRKSEDGSVVIEEAPTDSETWQEAYEAHQESLGNLWLSGSLGGVPTG